MKPTVSVTTSPYHINCTNPLASSTSTALKSPVVKTKQPAVTLETEMTDVSRLLMEIDHMKKDKNVTLGLLSHLQKDMANKVRLQSLLFCYNNCNEKIRIYKKIIFIQPGRTIINKYK